MARCAVAPRKASPRGSWWPVRRQVACGATANEDQEFMVMEPEIRDATRALVIADPMNGAADLADEAKALL